MKKEMKFVCLIVGVYYLITTVISIVCIIYNKYVTNVFFPDPLLKSPNWVQTLMPTIIQSLLMIVLSVILILFSESKISKTKLINQDDTNDSNISVDFNRLAKLTISLLLIFHAINHFTNSINADVTTYVTMKTNIGKYLSEYNFLHSFVKMVIVEIPVILIPIIEFIICLIIFTKQIKTGKNYKTNIEKNN